MKKIQLLSLLFAIVSVGVLTAACTPTETEGNTSTTIHKDAGKKNEFGWEIPQETLVISAFNASGEYAPSKEEKAGRENMEKFLLEKFNVKLEMVTTDGDGAEALNLALVSGKYPELIYDTDFDMVTRFKDQGRSHELSKYIDEKGKTIKEKCGDTYPLLLNDKGELWAIPIGVNELMEMPDRAASIRYDEWLSIKSPEISTPDNYYQALKDVLAKTPNNSNGEKRYAMSLYGDQNFVRDFGGFWGLKNGWLVDSSKKFTYWTDTAQGKAMTKWFNQIYRDGLLDPDAFTHTFDDWKAKFSSERIAGAIGGWWMVYNAGHEVWQATDSNYNENKRYIQVGFKAPEAEAAYVNGKVRSGGAYTIITDKVKAEKVNDIIEFINFQASDVGHALFYWGIPNGVKSTSDPSKTIKEWNIDKDGKWSFDPEAKKAFINETWDYTQEALLGTGTYTFFSSYDRWADGEHHVWASHMWFSENKWKTIMINNLKDSIYDATPYELSSKSLETSLIEQALRDAWTQYWPMVVQAKSDAEFERAWKNLQDAVKGANVADYTKTMEENYKNNMKKLGK